MINSPAQRAEQAGCSVDLIYTAIRSGDLTAINIGGPQRPTYRISDEDWDAFLEKRKTSRLEPGTRRRRKPQTVGVTEFFA